MPIPTAASYISGPLHQQSAVYYNRIYSTLGVLCHLKSFVHNAKCSQVINWLATLFCVLLGVGITWAHCSQ